MPIAQDLRRLSQRSELGLGGRGRADRVVGKGREADRRCHPKRCLSRRICVNWASAVSLEMLLTASAYADAQLLFERFDALDLQDAAFSEPSAEHL